MKQKKKNKRTRRKMRGEKARETAGKGIAMRNRQSKVKRPEN